MPCGKDRSSKIGRREVYGMRLDVAKRNNDHEEHNPGTEVQNGATINIDNNPSLLVS